MRRWLGILALLIAGCGENIYVRVEEPRVIAHPPSSVALVDPEDLLHLRSDPHASVHVLVEHYCARCAQPLSRSMGSDMDGYIRITVVRDHRLLAKAQLDYKGEATQAMAQSLYYRLMEELQWPTQLS